MMASLNHIMLPMDLDPILANKLQRQQRQQEEQQEDYYQQGDTSQQERSGTIQSLQTNTSLNITDSPDEIRTSAALPSPSTIASRQSHQSNSALSSALNPMTAATAQSFAQCSLSPLEESEFAIRSMARQRQKIVTEPSQEVRRTPITGRISRAKKGQPVHVCEFCEKVFTRAEHRRRHELSHKDAQYPCREPGCGKVFYRPDLLDRHKTRHEEDSQAAAAGGHDQRSRASSQGSMPRTPDRTAAQTSATSMSTPASNFDSSAVSMSLSHSLRASAQLQNARYSISPPMYRSHQAAQPGLIYAQSADPSPAMSTSELPFQSFDASMSGIAISCAPTQMGYTVSGSQSLPRSFQYTDTGYAQDAAFSQAEGMNFTAAAAANASQYIPCTQPMQQLPISTVPVRPSQNLPHSAIQQRLLSLQVPQQEHIYAANTYAGYTTPQTHPHTPPHNYNSDTSQWSTPQSGQIAPGMWPTNTSILTSSSMVNRDRSQSCPDTDWNGGYVPQQPQHQPQRHLGVYQEDAAERMQRQSQSSEFEFDGSEMYWDGPM